MKLKLFFLTALTAGAALVASASEGHDALRPDGHAPIGVMGDHTHAMGEWMLSYRYLRMEMSGDLLDGSDSISRDAVLGTYMNAPEEMTTMAHLFGWMYAPNDVLTLTAMIPYLDKEMESVNRMGQRRTMTSDGIGDIKISGLVIFKQWDGQQIHFNLGLSLPTGTVDENNGNVRMPYPMQLGSGTYDLLPGVTYFGHADAYSWGGQIAANLRVGENDNDYNLGNVFGATAWGAYAWCPWSSTSLRLAYTDVGEIDGADPEINAMMSPGADPDASGREQLELGIGVNAIVPDGKWAGHRLAVELILPLHEDTGGPQLESDYKLVFGWQKAW